MPFPSPMHECMLSHFSHFRFCATPWTAAHQAPLSTGFSRQEYWSGLPFPSPMHACMHAKLLQLCPTLCDPMGSSPPGSSVHRILYARIPEWVAISSPSEVAQSCLTLCDLMYCSLPDSSVHGIFQARILEWGAIAFSKTFR